MTIDSYRKLVFGIYPGGEAGSDDGIATGRPDDPRGVARCLDLLQGQEQMLVVRAYERYSDPERPSRWAAQMPKDYGQYCRPDRQLDLVAMFQSARGDIAGYLQFVRDLIGRHGPRLYSLQITEEANFSGAPDAIDGYYPQVRKALVHGVVAARDELDRLGYGTVKVGFNATPTFGVGAEFWADLGRLGGDAFRSALDYVGLDFFPDVFRPVAPDGQPGDLRQSVATVLETMRREWLPAAGISADVPIHIAENGWPTGPTRSYERQAEVLEAVIRTVYAHRERLNIERYTLFSLRDTDSSRPELAGDIFYHFGLTEDDYTPKPAFHVYWRLIAEMGTRLESVAVAQLAADILG
jgi:hypothetical protein